MKREDLPVLIDASKKSISQELLLTNSTISAEGFIGDYLCKEFTCNCTNLECFGVVPGTNQVHPRGIWNNYNL